MEEEAKTIEKQLPKETSPIVSWDVLLSYAVEDAGWVKAVEEELKGLHLKIFDPYATSTEFWGRNREDVVAHVFPANCQVVFLVLSSAYSASEQCHRELMIITEGSLRNSASLILPARLDDSPVPEALRSISTLDVKADTPIVVAQGIGAKIDDWRRSLSQVAADPKSRQISRTALIEMLTERVGPEIARLRRMIPGVDAEEVVQDALIQTIATLERRSISDPRAFLAYVVRNLAIHRLREFEMESKPTFKRGRCNLGALRDVRKEIVEDPLEQQETVASLRRAIEQLPAMDQQLIMLHYIDGLTFEEVGKTLGISGMAVRSRSRRALALLRTMMEVQE